jgi:predicted metal-dependent enzyme (double-stranded beta helix superfamily)
MSTAPPPGQLCRAPTSTIGESQPGLSELLAAVRALARSSAVAEGGRLRRPVPSRPATKRWYQPLCAGELDAWVIWWARGGEVDLHDHGGAAGAVYVLEGTLLETHGTSRGGRLQQRALHADSSIVFGSDYVHDVVNVCPQPAVSLHVYGPRLDAMTYYRVDERSGRLVPDRTQRVDHIAEARSTPALTA